MDQICLKRGIPIGNKKKWTSPLNSPFRISLGTEFQLKLTILIFWVKFAQKEYLQSKTEKSEHYHWILHIRISRGTKFQLKPTILMFWTKFAQKVYSWLEIEKWHLCMRPWLLLTILNFSARGPTDITIFYCLFSF